MNFLDRIVEWANDDEWHAFIVFVVAIILILSVMMGFFALQPVPDAKINPTNELSNHFIEIGLFDFQKNDFGANMSHTPIQDYIYVRHSGQEASFIVEPVGVKSWKIYLNRTYALVK